MSKIVIKRRISLEFLGEEYKDAHLTFKAIPVSDYHQISKELEKVDENPSASIDLILSYLKKYFLSGQFPVDGKLEDLDKDDIDGLDQDTVVESFKAMTGQIDPKDKRDSETSSTTAEVPQNS